MRYRSPDIKHKYKYTLACACVHAYTHAYMHMCTFLPNMLSIPQSETFKATKAHKFASYLTIYLKRSCHWCFFVGSYSQLLFLPFQLHSGGHFIIIIDYGAHLVKAQSAYNDIRIHSFHQTHARTPTHTHYKYLYYW